MLDQFIKQIGQYFGPVSNNVELNRKASIEKANNVLRKGMSTDSEIEELLSNS